MLAELRVKGLKLSVEGDKLIVDVAPGVLMTDELRGMIRANKSELLRELADEARPQPKFPAWTRQRYAERRGRRRGRPAQLGRQREIPTH
jgi:hypothetical protein